MQTPRLVSEDTLIGIALIGVSVLLVAGLLYAAWSDDSERLRREEEDTDWWDEKLRGNKLTLDEFKEALRKHNGQVIIATKPKQITKEKQK